MAKKHERIFLKVNALIVAVLGLMGCHSCSYYVKYGVPDFPGNDSMYIDTTIHCMYGVPMYGVMPVEKYGVPGGEWAPERGCEVQSAPENEEAPQTPEPEEIK